MLARGGPIRASSAGSHTTPPARFCVFSTSTSVVGGKIRWPRGFTAAVNSSAVNRPSVADLAELHAGVRRARAGLVPDGVGLAADDHLVARLREELQRELVGHVPARHPAARPPCRAAPRRAPAAR